jgi:hypothetical protein
MRFGEVARMHGVRRGLVVTLAATLDGQPQLRGHVDRGNAFGTRRHECVARHWFHVETRAPDASEVNDTGEPTILAVRARAS